jgi:hypothetical protein
VLYWAFVKNSSPFIRLENTMKAKGYLGRCMPQKLSKRPNISKWVLWWKLKNYLI